jgi:hypothetical protein
VEEGKLTIGLDLEDRSSHYLAIGMLGTLLGGLRGHWRHWC